MCVGCVCVCVMVEEKQEKNSERFQADQLRTTAKFQDTLVRMSLYLESQGKSADWLIERMVAWDEHPTVKCW